MTALMWAAELNKNPEVIKTLLEAGADVRAKDNFGKNVLDCALMNEKLKDTSILNRIGELILRGTGS